MKLKIALGVTIGLLVAVLVVGVIIVQQLNRAAEQDRYERCLAAQGFDLGERADPGQSIEDYTEGLVEQADRCL